MISGPPARAPHNRGARSGGAGLTHLKRRKGSARGGMPLEFRGARVGLAWDSRGTRVGLAWDSRGTRVGLAWDSRGTRLGLAWDSRGTRVGLAWDSRGTRVGALMPEASKVVAGGRAKRHHRNPSRLRGTPAGVPEPEASGGICSHPRRGGMFPGGGAFRRCRRLRNPAGAGREKETPGAPRAGPARHRGCARRPRPGAP
jgi:hypothetical protein